MLLGQRVKMKNRKMLNEFFDNDGVIVKTHKKDKKIHWVKFSKLGIDEVLNLHETELEEIQ